MTKLKKHVLLWQRFLLQNKITYHRCNSNFTCMPRNSGVCLDRVRGVSMGRKGAQCSGSRITGEGRKVPKVAQVLSSMQYICSRMTLDSNMGEPSLFPLALSNLVTPLSQRAVLDINKIPFSGNTISRRIAHFSGDMECNVQSKIKGCELSALLIDASTEISGKTTAFVYCRFIQYGTIVEDFLFCRKLPGTEKGQDIYDVLNSRLLICELTWRSCVGVSTDGEPAMTEAKGFVSLAQQRKFSIIVAHCFLNREALIAKTVKPEVKFVVDVVVEIVDYMKLRPKKCRQFEKL